MYINWFYSIMKGTDTFHYKTPGPLREKKCAGATYFLGPLFPNTGRIDNSVARCFEGFFQKSNCHNGKCDRSFKVAGIRCLTGRSR